MSRGGVVGRQFSVVLIAALIASAAWAAKSSHAAVTIGSDLTTTPTEAFICNDPISSRGCLFVNDVSFALPRQLAAPIDGVIVRWRIRLGNTTNAQSIRLRVVRHFDANQFTMISSGALEPIPAGEDDYEFPARLPILADDQLAVESGKNAAIELRAPLTGGVVFGYNPSPADGATTPAPDSGLSAFDVEVPLNADIEPDADHDGFGDETQDQCPTNATTQGPCPVSPAAPAGTGQRAAALKQCKKKAKKKDWTKKQLKKCQKKANLLPV